MGKVTGSTVRRLTSQTAIYSRTEPFFCTPQTLHILSGISTGCHSFVKVCQVRDPSNSPMRVPDLNSAGPIPINECLSNARSGGWAAHCATRYLALKIRLASCAPKSTAIAHFLFALLHPVSSITRSHHDKFMTDWRGDILQGEEDHPHGESVHDVCNAEGCERGCTTFPLGRPACCCRGYAYDA